MTHDAHLLLGALAAAADAPTAPSAHGGPLWGILALSTLAIWAWLGRRQRTLMGRITALQAEAAAEQLLAGERAHTAAQQLRAAKAALRASEQQLAAQKKKNYDLGRALAEANRATHEALAAAASQRRAPVPSREPPKLQVAAPAAAKVQVAPPADATPPPPADVAPPEAAPTSSAADAERAQQLAATAAALAESQAALALAQSHAVQAQAEGRRLHKRIEDLRRVDLMSRGKLQVLEDKVARLGREHYEAISALALVRGEVALPKRRRAPRPARPSTEGHHAPEKVAKADAPSAVSAQPPLAPSEAPQPQA